MANIRNPQYGVEKDELTLTSQDPASVLYGVNANNRFIPIKVGLDGSLAIGAVSLDMSDVQIGAVEVKNASSDDRLTITSGGEALTQARLYDSAGVAFTATTVGPSHALDINVVGGTPISASTEEDDSVPAGMELAALINLTYGYDGVDWQRINSTSGRLHVDGSGVTQPISASSLPLPTGASTEATLSSFRTDFNAVDFATEVTLNGIKAQTDLFTFTGSALDVNIASGVTLEVNLDNANDDVLVYGNDGVANRVIRTDVNGELQVDVLTLPSDIDVRDLDSAQDSIEVLQATHDNLNLNANIQVGNTDVANGNPVPISDAGGSITVDGTVAISNFPAVQTVAISQTGTDNDVDIADDVARELGRISASDTIHTEETYNTTDTDSNARPTNGNFVVRHHKTKSIAVANTGANNARITIHGSVDGGTNFDIVISNNIQVNAANTLVVTEERAMTHVRVLARAANAGNQTTIVTRGYSLGN